MSARFSLVRLALTRFRLLLLVAFTAVAGCGGNGETGAQASDQDERLSSTTEPNSAALTDFLYANAKAVAVYHSGLSAPSHSHTLRMWQDSGLEFEGARLDLVEISYPNVSLPQFSVHATSQHHQRLLVYNHGHGGLPTPEDFWAQELLRRAFASGFDLLITSMPAVGLNRLDPTREYWAVTWGSNRPVAVDQRILNTWPWTHQFYEIINDQDSYLHFFIDQMVVLAQQTDARANAARPTRRLVASAQGFPERKYVEIVYLGLSGGGATGLTACAVFSFDKCILVAGFLPEYLRVQSISAWGDSEQTSRSFYSVYPYDALIGLAEVTSRRVIYFYNRFDSCCYGDPLASTFKRDYPHLDIRLTDLPYHGFEADEVLRELAAPPMALRRTGPS
jgi:hypothetical protein